MALQNRHTKSAADCCAAAIAAGTIVRRRHGSASVYVPANHTGDLAGGFSNRLVLGLVKDGYLVPANGYESELKPTERARDLVAFQSAAGESAAA